MTIKTNLERIEDFKKLGQQSVLELRDVYPYGLQSTELNFENGSFGVIVPVEFENTLDTENTHIYDTGVSIEQPPVAVTPAVADLLAEYEKSDDLTFDGLLDKAIDLYLLNTHYVMHSNIKQDAFLFIADVIRYGYTPDNDIEYQIKSSSLPKGLQYFIAEGDAIKLTDDEERAWLSYDQLKQFNLVDLLRKAQSVGWMHQVNDYEFTLNHPPQTDKQPTLTLFNIRGKIAEPEGASSSESTVDSIFCEPLSDTIDPTEC